MSDCADAGSSTCARACIRDGALEGLPDSGPVTVNLAQASLEGLSVNLRTSACGHEAMTVLLNLSRNSLRSIDNVRFPLVLADLDVSHNRIESVGNLSGLSSLHNLRLAFNDVERLPEATTRLPVSLLTLDLSHNRLGNDLDGVVMLPNGLQLLNLSHNAISSVEGLDIAYGTAIDLSFNNLTSVRNVSWPDDISALYLMENPLDEFYPMFYKPLDVLCFGKNPPARFSATRSQFDRLQKFTKNVGCPPTPLTSPPVDPCRSGPSATLWGVYTVCLVQDDWLDAKMDGDATPMPIFVAPSHTLLHVAIALIALTLVGLVLGVIWTVHRRRRSIKETMWLHPERAETNYNDSSDFHEHVPHDLRLDTRYAQHVIPHTDLSLLQVVAHGGFGIVYFGHLKVNGGVRPVAVKRILPERFKHDKYAVEDFMDEIRLCLRLQHPHIVRCLGFSCSSVLSTLSCVSEFMPHGDLWTLLELDQKTRLLSWNLSPEPSRVVDASLPLSKLRVLHDVVSAMVYVHGQDVIHRDLKARNVLLNDAFAAKITDFGTSRKATEHETMTAEIGTVAWIAPEVLKGVRYSAKADVYSLGVFLSELDTLEIPYSNMPRLVPRTGVSVDVAKTRIAMLVVAGELTPVFSECCPPAIRDLARRCLAYAPDDRPSMDEVLHWLDHVTANDVV
ncbi:TKL protein kinase [Saprolegnia diclina VS20]|uniref:TKL protein kinase n=1 Tax=Saprolegnia diclina (strain VS20) TaxID=1156394 RepID=T0QD59_SAPDV|nr:TKL protein kinase [Saprolegnia diclina VS20]EQC31465.1 TKL protein kinase [Saprolegnia diclina VS20]|eukprot:XP_008615306.1 TKL protein kinase [Saprolegnia diclina VS20]